MKDAIIVLACGIKNGDLTDEAKRRVEKGVELYKKKVANYIVMSGSLSERINSKIFTEAELMKKYAAYLGVSPGRIILENSSKDTLSSAYFVKKILDERKWKDVAVVTSKFHLRRTKYIFNNIFGPSGINSKFYSSSSSYESNLMNEKRERGLLEMTKKVMNQPSISSAKRALLFSSLFMVFRSLKFVKINV